MAAHARPPQEPLPPNTVEGSIENVEGAQKPISRPRPNPRLNQLTRKKRGRKPRILLPNDDPFVLIGMVNETGGALADAEKKPMNPTQMAAFRQLCLMPPGHRSLVRLSTQLGLPYEEGGWGKPPNRKSLEKWSSYWNWQKLLSIYDESLDRYRLYRLEQDRLEARTRHAASARRIQVLAGDAMEAELAPPPPMPDGTPAPLPVHPRTGTPMRPGNRVQGLAFAWKAAVEAERLSLGLPSTITDQKVVTDNRTESVQVTMTLDEWRRQTRLSRMTPEEIEAEKVAGQQLALPAPAADKPWLKNAPVKPEDLEDLPASWFESDQPLARPPSAPSAPVVADAPESEPEKADTPS